MTDNDIISQASEEQFNVACDATDASKNILSEASVIKALECCATFTDGDCSECQYQNRACRTELIKDVFDLVNRQKAEIERLQKLNNELHKNIRENATNELHVLLGEVRFIEAEAIKEFAERLEYFVLNEDTEINELKCKDYESYMGGCNQFRLQIVKGINNILKEMTEQKNEGEGKEDEMADSAEKA